MKDELIAISRSDASVTSGAGERFRMGRRHSGNSSQRVSAFLLLASMSYLRWMR